MSGYLVSFYCETNTHAGGDESIGTVDLPIQRNSITGHPEFFDSTVKGALKRHVAAFDPGLAKRAFGGDPKGADEPGVVHAGTAHVLLAPQPTGRDTFWWFTCPLALAQTARLAEVTGCEAPPVLRPNLGADGVAANEMTDFIVRDVLVNLAADDGLSGLARFLDRFLPVESEAPGAYDYFHARLTDGAPKLAVLEDGLFSLLCGTGVVQPRNQLGERKRSENLWYTEYLPSETVMLTKLSGPDDVTAEVVRAFATHPVLQLGGLEGLGAGRLRVTVVGSANDAEEAQQ